MSVRSEENQEKFIDHYALIHSRPDRYLPQSYDVSAEPRVLYEVRLFIAAIGKLAEERNLAFSIHIDKLHRPFLEYVNIAGLALSVGDTITPVTGPVKSVALVLYKDRELFREPLNHGMVYPRLFYNRYRGRIDNCPFKESVMEAASEVMSNFCIIGADGKKHTIDFASSS